MFLRYVTTFRNRETRVEWLEAVDEGLTYDARALDRRVVSKDQIRDRRRRVQ